MTRSQRHKVEIQGYASDGKSQAQGGHSVGGSVVTPPQDLAAMFWSQSNVHGGQVAATGATIISPADDPHPQVFQYSPNGGLGAGDPLHTRIREPAVEPLRFPAGAVLEPRVGPPLKTCKLIIATKPAGSEITAMTFGKGGTGMGEWVQGQPLFESAEAAWLQIRSERPGIILDSMYASLGENEMQGGTLHGAIPSLVDAYINNCRGLPGASAATPFIMGAPVPLYVDGNAEFRLILLELAKAAVRNPMVGITGGLVGGGVGGDTWHYTNASNRGLRAQWWFDQRARVAQFNSSPAPQVTVHSLAAQTLTFTSVGVPYYTIEVSPDGVGSWVPTEWVPNQDNSPGQIFSLTLPGAGTRFYRIRAHTYSTPAGSVSSIGQYTAPGVTVPPRLVLLDFNAATMDGTDPTLIVSVPSVGTDTGAWQPAATAGVGALAAVTRIAQNGINIGVIANANKRIKRVGWTIPAGDYTIAVPMFMTSGFGTGAAIFAWNQASSLGDIYFAFANSQTNLRIGHTNSTTQQITTGAPVTGMGGKWILPAVTYNRAANIAHIYLNSADLACSGTLVQRVASPSNSGGSCFYGFNADTTSNGVNNSKEPPPGIWNQELTAAELAAWQAEVAATFSIVFG